MPGDAIPILRVNGQLKSTLESTDAATLKLYNELSPSVVKIESEKGNGSGFAQGKPGQIVTNYHVVSDIPEVFVRTQDGQRYRAKVVKADDIKDLALLEIDGRAPDYLKPLQLGDDKRLKTDDQIAALGHPDGASATYWSPGKYIDLSNNLQRFSPEEMKEFARLSATESDKNDFLQTKLLHSIINVRHGSSGGPAVDSDGKVVGVTVYTKDKSETEKYFVPASDVKEFLDQKTPKFTFDYEYKPSSIWAKEYVQTLKEHPLMTAGFTAGGAYGAWTGVSHLGKFGSGLSGGIAAYGGLRLIGADIPDLLNAHNNRDLLKSGLDTFGDSALLAGGLTRYALGTGTRIAGAELLQAGESKLATTIGAGLINSSERYLSKAGKVGIAIIAVGVAARMAASLVPNRLVNTGVHRTNGDARIPFDLIH